MKGKLGKLTLCVFLLLMCLGATAMAATLTLPSSLKVIEEEAFCGDSSLDTVIVPEGVTEIGPRAFADSSLKEIRLPDSLTDIDATALDGVEGVTVTANEGSNAYKWALACGYIEGGLPESLHHYVSGATAEWDYSHWKNVSGLKLCFSKATCLSESDSLTITDSTGKARTFSTSELAGVTIGVTGSSFHLTLQSYDNWG